MSAGGPAFPHLSSGSASESQYSNSYDISFTSCGGMSLRDYFAAQALAFVADPNVKVGDERSTEIIAKIAYGIADAMLKERAK
jgi:hypothetical protein